MRNAVLLIRSIALRIALVGVIALPAIAWAKVCSAKEAEMAAATVDDLGSWDKVWRAAKKYGHCDDGSIAEGYSEAVARLLIDRWSTLPALARIAKDDPAFKLFVVRHIDTTLDTDDLEKIRNLSSTACPAGNGILCAALRVAAERSIQ